MEKEERLFEDEVPEIDDHNVETMQVCGPNTTPYVVKRGDTFFTIARDHGVSVDALVRANPQISNPSNIRPGQIVCIPNQPTQCPNNTFPYVVQRGDTMFTIANRFGVSVQSLIAANPQIPDPSRLTPGQIVCVPEVRCPANTMSYTVQRGDTMFTIAQMFGVPLNELLAANPQVSDPNRLFPGQNICVPRVTPPGPCPPGTFAYTVQPGDSMWLIAQRYGVSLDALIRANPQIPDPSRISPGQIVCVPGSAPPPGPCPAGTWPYTVKQGDSMWLIAQRYGVSLDALIRANPQISNPNNIKPGQIVCVPTGSPTPGPCPAGTFAYTVKSGDSMWLIAQRYGVSLDALIRANPQISNPSSIKPGQIICVPNR